MAKLYFQQALLQTSVSHDPSEIILICWFAAQGTFLGCASLCFLLFVLETDIFSGFFGESKGEKNSIYLK